MRPSSRSLSARRTDCPHRYLKPGALAQFRNIKISARSHKSVSISHRIGSPLASPQIYAIDQVPCFQGKIYGPYCLKRKKFMAARSVFVLNLGSLSPALDSTNVDSLITSHNNDALAAH